MSTALVGFRQEVKPPQGLPYRTFCHLMCYGEQAFHYLFTVLGGVCSSRAVDVARAGRVMYDAVVVYSLDTANSIIAP